ncbi:serine hydrolase domain-containing protein [Roseivirga sp. 4D4]|uniref:serine hydrolase domain-containing protein n=1 Tax=Roseivirga sp. 4D4 TaxID=1889784 RepID=UPI0009F2E432|nr:serine hydrolase [Roseivirga sp. 4D4]
MSVRCSLWLSMLFIAIQVQGQDDPVFITQKQVVRGINRAGDGLRSGRPDVFEIDAKKLNDGIDRIMQQAIDSMAFPGGQVLIAKQGLVIYHKAFGYHTYDKVIPVDTTDIYDLASVTKTTASTLALMKLYDMGLFNPDKTMGEYFPDVAKGKKKNLVMRDVLAHQAGLRAWIPYWSESQKRNGKYRNKTVSRDSSANYPYRISEAGLFMHKDFIQKKIYKMIRKSKVSKDKRYVYSGLTFYLIPELVRRLTGKSFDQFLYDEFYVPMGANTLRFNAGKQFDLDRIVPTEVDTFFRMQILHGVVHDEGAAMMLGVSGNAGLFSRAADVAKVYQMLLNGGQFEGNTYLKESTIQEFTDCQFCEVGNRRGMGFDKPLVEYDANLSSVAKGASEASFGHSGYTGTLVWADPDNDLLFVFLSNRVYPTRNNSKIYQLNVRPDIHNLVYELLRVKQGTYTMGMHW